ncbi:MAG: addiction module toxin, HicA family [Dehalococcoidia bacterium]|nr:addiction module toxin, HicA family [Dehalococcoidia bacterium]
MTRLPAVRGRQVIAALERAGFEVVRQRGSHVRLAHPDGRLTVVPFHARETIDRGLLRDILRQAGISREEFLRLLRG